jgi:hypothetical protein
VEERDVLRRRQERLQDRLRTRIALGEDRRRRQPAEPVVPAEPRGVSGRRLRSLPSPGDQFGRLTVREIVRGDDSCTRARCACDCGAEKLVTPSALRRGDVRSCGCAQAERRQELREKMTRHMPAGGAGDLTATL